MILNQVMIIRSVEGQEHKSDLPLISLVVLLGLPCSAAVRPADVFLMFSCSSKCNAI